MRFSYRDTRHPLRLAATIRASQVRFRIRPTARVNRRRPAPHMRKQAQSVPSHLRMFRRLGRCAPRVGNQHAARDLAQRCGTRAGGSGRSSLRPPFASHRFGRHKNAGGRLIAPHVLSLGTGRRLWPHSRPLRNRVTYFDRRARLKSSRIRLRSRNATIFRPCPSQFTEPLKYCEAPESRIKILSRRMTRYGSVASVRRRCLTLRTLV